MRKVTLVLLALLMASTGLTAKRQTKFAKKLAALPGVTSVVKQEQTKFKEAYLVTFAQPVEHRDPTRGSFTQRVLVCHVNEDSATVMVTEGYDLDRYLRKTDYREELSEIFNTNCIVVEHRYFGGSKPELKDKGTYWDYLTTYNAATDHHKIAEAFHKLYHGKFIATGVSKGGICANMFRAYYPEDVDITVPYVAPLCDGPEDPRMAKAIMGYGSREEQQVLREFITYLLNYRAIYESRLKEYCDSMGLKPRIEVDELYDFMVMDMHVALLARGEVKKIPDYKSCPADSTFAFVAKYGAPDGFTPSYDNMPYYVQAVRELGHYALMPQNYTGIKAVNDAQGYLWRTALPEECGYGYDPSMRKMVLGYLNTRATRMLFIYGEYDPWTAVGIKDLVKNDNIYVFVNPGNCHRSKIRNFPKETEQKIVTILSKWLYEK